MVSAIKRSRTAGATADWLHNLAQFDSFDFRNFSEERFWADHAICCHQYPDARFERYRQIIDLYLNGDIYPC